VGGCFGQSRASFPVSAILAKYANSGDLAKIETSDMDSMNKISGLKEILALDPRNSFARYGIAMELASRGETDAALSEFDQLLVNDPDYTAGYFMAAQTLASGGRSQEAIARLKDGINCAARNGNSHALSEMQTMLGELEH
jgi:predicted Zn-dependent protease